MNRRSAQTFPAFLQNEAANVTGIVLGPDHEHIGDRAVGDPHLAAGKAVAAFHFARTTDHRARVGAVVRLGQAEAADPLARRQFRQVLLLLRFGTEFIDWHHHQRGLHAHHRAIAGVDALDFTGDQAIADIVQAAATVLLGDGCAQQANLAHFAKDRWIGLLMTESFEDARRKALLSELRSRVANHSFFFSELLIQQQGIDPVEASFTAHECVLSNRVK
ncbi:hypothetical protein D9M71_288580 [compost metagenome]